MPAQTFAQRPVTHVQGWRLALLRMAWGVGALIGVGSFVARLPGHYADLQRTCAGLVCAYGQLTPQAAHVFQTLGVSLGMYAMLRAGLTVVVALTFFVLATVLAWRKTNDWFALLVALWIVCAGTAMITGALGLGTGSTVQGHEVPARAVNVLAEYGTCLLVFALFPTQRIVPRAAFWLLVGVGLFVAGPSPFGTVLTVLVRLGVLAGLMVAQTYHIRYISGGEPHQPQWQWMTRGIAVLIGAAMVLLVVAAAGHALTSPALLTFYAAVIGAEVLQLSRYWQVASPIERQQTKWSAFGIAVFVLMAAVLLAPVLFRPALGQSGSFYQTIHTLILIVVSLAVPVTISVAILRYQLWDIDDLINRTLVYGTLTAMLAAIFFGIVLVAQAVLQTVTGQTGQQPLFIVASTLVTFALFTPLRRRLQSGIDRRFYRRKYDAARTLAAFGAMLHTQTDLAGLSGQLVAVVQQTMQPVSVELWLRPPGARVQVLRQPHLDLDRGQNAQVTGAFDTHTLA
jgi:hypothetical protein